MISLAITSLPHLTIMISSADGWSRADRQRTRFNKPTAWLREIPSIYKLRVSLGSSRSRGFSKLTRRRLYGSIKTEVYASHVSGRHATATKGKAAGVTHHAGAGNSRTDLGRFQEQGDRATPEDQREDCRGSPVQYDEKDEGVKHCSIVEDGHRRLDDSHSRRLTVCLNAVSACSSLAAARGRESETSERRRAQ
jgi:hypothetical protein